MTTACFVRISRSLEELCYCVLAAQSGVRHSIQGMTGREAQNHCVKFVEDKVTIAEAIVLILKFQNSLEKAR